MRDRPVGRSARKGPGPLALALRQLAIEAVETRRRRALERAEQRAKMTVVDGGRREDAA